MFCIDLSDKAVNILAEKVERLELENKLRKASTTTTRTEVYVECVKKNLISTLKPESFLTEINTFHTNMFTTALNVVFFLLLLLFANYPLK